MPSSLQPASAQEPALVSFEPAATKTGRRPSSGLETPLFFDSHDRPLFAVYHAPSRDRPGAPVVVHCHGLGVEQITLYRAEVLAARAAAATGFPVLRFHARGHGDSAGDFGEVTLEGLVEDAIAAAGEAVRRSGASRVVWLGARFGSLVAAAAHARLARSAGLVLWGPVHHPADYFRGLLRGLLYSQVAEGKKPEATVDELLERVRRDGRVDVHGYYLHRAIVESARTAELTGMLAGFAGPLLMIQIETRHKLSPANAELATALEARGARVTTHCLAEEPGWHFTQNPAWESETLVRRTVEWLDALA